MLLHAQLVQRLLCGRRGDLGVTHPSVADRLPAVVHGQSDVDGHLEVRQSLVDPSGRDLSVTHVSERNGLLRASPERHQRMSFRPA